MVKFFFKFLLLFKACLWLGQGLWYGKNVVNKWMFGWTDALKRPHTGQVELYHSKR